MVLKNLSPFLLISLSCLYLGKHCASGDEQDVKESGGYSSYKSNDGGISRYEILSNKMIREDARIACRKKGMVLAYADSLHKYAMLTGFLRANNYTPEDMYSGYWVGGYRKADTEPYKWENGIEIDWYGWVPGEPTAFDNENCIELKKDRMLLGWNDLGCDNLRKTICEKEEFFHEEKYKNVDSLSRVSEKPETRVDAEKHKIVQTTISVEHTTNAMLHSAEVIPHVETDPMYDYDYDTGDYHDGSPSIYSSIFYMDRYFNANQFPTTKPKPLTHK